LVPYVVYALYLGAGPGVGGHTLLNYLLKYLSPLTISTALLSEPLLGSVMGYFLGMQAIPGIYTWLGGIVLVLGLYMILLGEHKSQQRETEETEAS